MGRRTPLYDAHRALGARLVEFGGWDMPLAYAGPTEEHRAVRTRCGLFDVSHMGELEIAGPGARAFCQRLTTNDVDRLAVGDAQYTLICNERGASPMVAPMASSIPGRSQLVKTTASA
jgi:aminomethyltransferase